MALLDFLGGGILTYVVIVVVLFLFWIAWKLILSPLFGFGKKSIELSDRALSGLGKSWSAAAREAGHLNLELATEGASDQRGKRAAQTMEGLGSLLNESQSRQDFSSERVDAVRRGINAVSSDMKEEAAAFDTLFTQYKADRREVDRILRSVKQQVGDQQKIMRETLERRDKLARVGQTDPFAGELVRLTENIINRDKELTAAETQDKNLLRQVTSVAETRIKKVKGITSRFDEMDRLLKLEPPLQQVPKLQEQVQQIKRILAELSAEHDELRALLQRRKELLQGVMRTEGELRLRLEEQKKQIQASEAHFQDLRRRGAA